MLNLGDRLLIEQSEFAKESMVPYSCSDSFFRGKKAVSEHESSTAEGGQDRTEQIGGQMKYSYTIPS